MSIILNSGCVLEPLNFLIGNTWTPTQYKYTRISRVIIGHRENKTKEQFVFVFFRVAKSHRIEYKVGIIDLFTPKTGANWISRDCYKSFRFQAHNLQSEKRRRQWIWLWPWCSVSALCFSSHSANRTPGKGSSRWAPLLSRFLETFYN